MPNNPRMVAALDAARLRWLAREEQRVAEHIRGLLREARLTLEQARPVLMALEGKANALLSEQLRIRERAGLR